MGTHGLSVSRSLCDAGAAVAGARRNAAIRLAASFRTLAPSEQVAELRSAQFPIGSLKSAASIARDPSLTSASASSVARSSSRRNWINAGGELMARNFHVTR